MYTISTFYKTGWNNDLQEEFVPPPETGLYDPAKKKHEKIRKDIIFRMHNKHCLILSGQSYVADTDPMLSFLLIHENQVSRKKITLNCPLKQNRVIDFVITAQQRIGVLTECTDGQYSKYLFITQDKDGRQTEEKLILPPNQQYFDIRKIRSLNDDMFFDVKLMAGRGLYKMRENGLLEEIYQSKHAFGIFLKDRENLLVALSSSDYAEHYWAIINTISGLEIQKASNQSIKAFTAIPIFTDNNDYTYSINGNEVAKLNIYNQSVKIFSFQNIIPVSDGEFFVFTKENMTIKAVKTKNGSVLSQPSITLKIPQEFTLEHGYNVSNINSKNDFIVTITKPGAEEVFIKYTSDGVFVGQLDKSEKLNKLTLQNTSTWQIDENGVFFAPVLDSEGLRIIQITPIS